jgi:hypothetical protein
MRRRQPAGPRSSEVASRVKWIVGLLLVSFLGVASGIWWLASGEPLGWSIGKALEASAVLHIILLAWAVFNTAA